jgi:hypothetical protein
VAVASLVAVAARATLIAAIDLTSWNAINLQYMMPAAPFVLLFVVVGFHLGAKVLWPQTPKILTGQS